MTGEGRSSRPCRLEHDANAGAHWPFGHGCRPCPAGCEQGLVRLHGKMAESGMDPMIRAVVGKETGVDVTASYEKAAKRRWIDGELVKLRAVEAQREGRRDERVTSAVIRFPPEAAADDLSRAHDARERLWKTGAFPALELALQLLAMTAPLRFEALRVYVIDQHFTPSSDVQERLDEIVDWLAGRMPRPIRLPADAAGEVAAWKHMLEHGRERVHVELRLERNRQIAELVEVQGWSLRRVGSVFDLSHERVRKIIIEMSIAATATASGPAA